MKLRRQLFSLDASINKKRPDLAEDESDLDDAWIMQHDIDTIAKEREKVQTKFHKQNEKRKADGEPLQPDSELKDRLAKVEDLKMQLDKERGGDISVAANMTVHKLLDRIARLDDRLNATKIQATDKEENKEISLGTSKMNYIDPRIIVAWCRSYDVPMEKVYSKTLVQKFRWAQDIPDDWKF
jgi:DNA topoisomerase-1